MSSTTPITDLATEALFRELADCEAPGELEGLLDIERRLRDLSFDTDPAAEEAAQASDLGRFEQQDLIGRGGQSLVFRAMDPRLDREVAIKVHSGFGTDGALGLRRMVHEARALAHLDLPGVVRIYDAYEEDGRAFVVMESVDGPPLSELIDVLAGRAQQPTEQSLALAAELEPIEARCRLIRDLARSLFAVHERGVIHRDVKPANVLVEDGLRPKWIDFGLSHKDGTETELTTGFLIGTPSYISAEQVKNRRTGASALSDQYSLGVLFYELLTLGNPFRRDTREETLDAIAAGDPPSPRSKNPRIPVEVERIVLHMLEPVPQARYEDAGALAKDLEAFLEHRPISIGSPTLVERTTKWRRRNAREVRWGAYGVAAIAVALMLFIGSEIWAQHVETRDRLEAIVTGLTPETSHFEAFDLFEDLAGLTENMARERSDLVAWTNRWIPVEEAHAHASAWLARAIEANETALAKRGITLDLSYWFEFLDLERELCPERRETARWRELGTLTYPDSNRLQFHQLVVQGMRYPQKVEAFPNDRLSSGFYFARMLDSTGQTVEREQLLLTSANSERIDVLSRLPSREFLDETLRLSFGSREEFGAWIAQDHPDWPASSADDGHSALLSTEVQILPRPVTWREFRDVFGPSPDTSTQIALWYALGQTGAFPTSYPESLLDEPARAIPRKAFAYASAVGMRLPTGLELLLALDRLPEFVHAEKELLGRPGSTTETTACLQFAAPNNGGPLSPYSIFNYPNESQSEGATFRLAISVQPRDH